MADIHIRRAQEREILSKIVPMSRVGSRRQRRAERKAQQPCHAFAKAGSCQYGDACRFGHNAPPPPGPASIDLATARLALRAQSYQRVADLQQAALAPVVAAAAAAAPSSAGADGGVALADDDAGDLDESGRDDDTDKDNTGDADDETPATLLPEPKQPQQLSAGRMSMANVIDRYYTRFYAVDLARDTAAKAVAYDAWQFSGTGKRGRAAVEGSGSSTTDSPTSQAAPSDDAGVAVAVAAAAASASAYQYVPAPDGRGRGLDQYVHWHSNRVAVVGLAPSHVLVRRARGLALPAPLPPDGDQGEGESTEPCTAAVTGSASTADSTPPFTVQRVEFAAGSGTVAAGGGLVAMAVSGRRKAGAQFIEPQQVRCWPHSEITLP
jgi:hypothetical protein